MASPIDTSGAPVDSPPSAPSGREGAARFGHLVAALFALVGLYVANHLLEWDVLPFLTDDFDRVLPLINLSFWVNLVVSLVRFAHPRKWLVAATEIVSTMAGIPALVRMWRVFPFEFDRAGFRWDLAFRAMLVVVFVGSLIGVVAAVGRTVAALAQRS